MKRLRTKTLLDYFTESKRIDIDNSGKIIYIFIVLLL